MKLRVVLGTMTFGSQTNQPDATAQLAHFVGAGHAEIDTARMYNKGRTALCSARRRDSGDACRVASKANAFDGYDKVLTAASVARQFAATSEALGDAPVDVYYLHNPDATTPILETLEAVDGLHKAGKIKELGLSNYAAWEVCHIHLLRPRHRSRGRGLPHTGGARPRAALPSAPAPRRLHADDPARRLRLLAGPGPARHRRQPHRVALPRRRRVPRLPVLDDDSRFRKGNTMYRERYLAECQLDSVDAFRDACAEAGVPPVHAALRWLQHHSSLVDGDGIIVGASRLAHLEENPAALASGDAPAPAVVDACDAGWAKIRRRASVPRTSAAPSPYVRWLGY